MALLLDSMEEFLMAGASDWSPRTVTIYRWHLSRLAGWLAEHDCLSVEGLTRRLLREWMAQMVDDWAPATRKGAITAARAWVKWLLDEGGSLADGAALVKVLKTPAVPETVQRTISAEECARLLEAAERAPEFGLTRTAARQVAARDPALVALLFDSLIRAAELCSLRVEDLDLERCTLNIRRGKGGRGRLAIFSRRTRDMLRDWIAERPAGIVGGWLFVALGGSSPLSPLSPRSLRMILTRLGERAGVDDVSPHAFRRGGCCEALLGGASSRIVMAAGGWSNLAMVERYSRAIELQDDRTQEAYRAAAPIEAAAKRRNGNSSPSGRP